MNQIIDSYMKLNEQFKKNKEKKLILSALMSSS